MNSNCCLFFFFFFLLFLFFSQLIFKVKKINSIRRISAHQVHRWSCPYDGKWSYSKWNVPWKKNQWATRDKTHFELAFAVFKTIIGIPRKQMFLDSVWYNCPSELMVIYLWCFCLFIGPRWLVLSQLKCAMRHRLSCHCVDSGCKAGGGDASWSRSQ